MSALPPKADETEGSRRSPYLTQGDIESVADKVALVSRCVAGVDKMCSVRQSSFSEILAEVLKIFLVCVGGQIYICPFF